MGVINFGIIGNLCKECSNAEESDERIYIKKAINEVLNEALELVCRQHEGGMICDCESLQAKKILEFIGNQCAFCDNKQMLIYNEVLPYIKKENPLREKEDKKARIAVKVSNDSGRKIIYPKSFQRD